MHFRLTRLVPAPLNAAVLSETYAALHSTHSQLLHEAIPHSPHRVGV
jgi:hypothetical protein